MPGVKSRRFSIFACLFVLLAALPCLAWSNKEHILLTRIAALRLIQSEDTPEEMKQWLRQITPGLRGVEQERDYLLHARVGLVPRDVDGVAYWSTVPDVIAGLDNDEKTVEPFGVHERLLHYIDLELLNPDPQKQGYRHDLSSKPALDDIPRDMNDPRYTQAGMLPFRVEQVYRELVEALREGRLNDRPGQFPRDDHAAKWAGYLAHYAQDNTQPHHATVDYKSRSYFPDNAKAPNVHAEMEYKPVDDEWNDYPHLREDLWREFVAALGKVEDPATTDDPWRSTIEVALSSYDALPLIGTAAQAARREDGTFDTAAFYHFTGTLDGRETSIIEMKPGQLALAVKRVERLWKQAWAEAHAGPATQPDSR